MCSAPFFQGFISLFNVIDHVWPAPVRGILRFLLPETAQTFLSTAAKVQPKPSICLHLFSKKAKTRSLSLKQKCSLPPCAESVDTAIL